MKHQTIINLVVPPTVPKRAEYNKPSLVVAGTWSHHTGVNNDSIRNPLQFDR